MPAFKSKKFTDNWKWPAELQFSKVGQSPACSASNKNTNYALHSIRYRTVKHWKSEQNSLKLNFANNFVSFKKFLKAFKKNIHSDNPTILWCCQRCSINLIVYLLVFPKQGSWKF